MSEQLATRMKFLRGLALLLLHLLSRFEVHGAERVPRTGAAMYVMNHLHWTDPVIGFVVVNRHGYMFAADKWENHWFVGPLLRFTQQVIFVARGEVDRKALSQAFDVLKQGHMLGIAPEGTRSKTGGLQQGREGPAYLASRTGAVIVPVGAYGQEQAERCWKRLRRPHVVVTVGEPFVLPGTPNKAKGEQLIGYTDEIMRRIAALLPLAYRGVYAEEGATPVAQTPAPPSSSSGQATAVLTDQVA
jgi:1-acyl-sn-glycerol-3-phosphate acyltransferase